MFKLQNVRLTCDATFAASSKLNDALMLFCPLPCILKSFGKRSDIKWHNHFFCGWDVKNNRIPVCERSLGEISKDSPDRRAVSLISLQPFMCPRFLIGGVPSAEPPVLISKVASLFCSPGFDLPITQTQIHMQKTTLGSFFFFLFDAKKCQHQLVYNRHMENTKMCYKI